MKSKRNISMRLGQSLMHGEQHEKKPIYSPMWPDLNRVQQYARSNTTGSDAYRFSGFEPGFNQSAITDGDQIS
jgi:hypothetical protein